MWQVTIRTAKLFDQYNHKLQANVSTDVNSSSSSSSASVSYSSESEPDCTIDPPSEIFLYERTDLGDIFVGVCSVADLLQYPVAAPAPDNVFFRTSSVDLVVRSYTLLDFLSTEIIKDIGELKANLVAVNEICTDRDMAYWSQAIYSSSSSSSSLESAGNTSSSSESSPSSSSSTSSTSSLNSSSSSSNSSSSRSSQSSSSDSDNNNSSSSSSSSSSAGV